MMNKLFTLDNRLKLNDVSPLRCSFEFLHLTPIRSVGGWNLNIFYDDVKVLNVSVDGKNVIIEKGCFIADDLTLRFFSVDL